jgi:hypothetical protein
MKQETWKKIEDHETYEVSDFGRLKNSRGTILKVGFIAGGLATTLCENNTMAHVRVARLVGRAFCPGYRKGLIPVYKDGDRHNCAASNLKWVPRSEIAGVPYSKNPKTNV